MNPMLLCHIKEMMVYCRNHPTDQDLYTITLELKDSIGNHQCNRFPLDVEKFMCKSLDILLEAIEEGEAGLVYDISDMLQGIPNMEYWQKAKNMRDYWRIYVQPVKRKWQLHELDQYKPRHFFGSV